jgi:glycerophosphoryl diester phosphodiesterase
VKILSHRGYWKQALEKNSRTAFLRSFNSGFGTETDVRDSNGKLVISHDPAIGTEMSFIEFLSLCPKNITLALNIKSDGLARQIKEELSKYPSIDYFVFDMSIPDMRSHLLQRNSVFARVSEFESNPPWLSECDGVWLDSFEELWFDRADIDYFLMLGKRVCVVSPELHRRDYMPTWNMIKIVSEYKNQDRLFLCTDFPEDAKKFFEDK